MLRRAALVGVLVLSASCNKTEEGDANDPVLAAPGPPARPGSGGKGFSAELAKEMDALASKSGAASGRPEAAKAGEPAKPSPSPPAGDAKAAGAAAVAEPASAGIAPVKAPAAPGAGDAPRSGEVARVEPASGGEAAASRTASVASSSETGSSGAPITSSPASIVVRSPTRGPVKVPAELAEIKLSLLPNWDRDVDKPGTFQYVVRVKGTQSTKTFSFHYGYDDPKAPTDREQYKKYLKDSNVLTGEIKDRQRGSAWFLEGSDASGFPAFRYVVLYGGKRLICYGSLYKDADSDRLGDDRDQTVIQAKQICETLAL